MLACAGVDRQHEHEPSRAPRPVRHRGGCDRELHADADGRVYACQLVPLPRVECEPCALPMLLVACKTAQANTPSTPRFTQTYPLHPPGFCKVQTTRQAPASVIRPNSRPPAYEAPTWLAED